MLSSISLQKKKKDKRKEDSQMCHCTSAHRSQSLNDNDSVDTFNPLPGATSENVRAGPRAERPKTSGRNR